MQDIAHIIWHPETVLPEFRYGLDEFLDRDLQFQPCQVHPASPILSAPLPIAELVLNRLSDSAALRYLSTAAAVRAAWRTFYPVRFHLPSPNSAHLIRSADGSGVDTDLRFACPAAIAATGVRCDMSGQVHMCWSGRQHL